MPMPGRAIEYLRGEHNDLRNLIAQYRRSEDNTTRRKLFDRIRDMMELHDEVEMQLFYPAVAEAGSDDVKALIDEARAEHRGVVDLIADIGDVASDATNPRFRTAMDALLVDIEDHLGHEETWIFPVAQQTLTREALDRLGREMDRMKLAADDRIDHISRSSAPGMERLI
ncbi:MAG: hemerythrin domain-containing protein [Myxococcota bacterium]